MLKIKSFFGASLLIMLFTPNVFATNYDCWCAIKVNSGSFGNKIYFDNWDKSTQLNTESGLLGLCKSGCVDYTIMKNRDAICGTQISAKACLSMKVDPLHVCVDHETVDLPVKACPPKCGPTQVECAKGCVYKPVTPALAKAYGCNIAQ